MQIARARRSSRLFSLTPLIDVVFLLLIFFMLATTFLDTRRVDVSVPRIDKGIGGIGGAFMISIRSTAKLEINGNAVPLDRIEALVRARLKQDPDQVIQIFPDNAVRLQRIMDVLDRVAAAGGRSVTLERQEAETK
jgi:biopolymer transport protein ExbD